MRKPTEEFFDNKAEQNKIKSAIHQAIPEGIFYHNLVIVLSEMIKDMVWEMTKEDIFKKSHRSIRRAVDSYKCDHSMAENGDPICPGCLKWLG